jgi:hypothetical protein
MPLAKGVTLSYSHQHMKIQKKHEAMISASKAQFQGIEVRKK